MKGNVQVRGLKFAAIASFALLVVVCILVGYFFLTAEVQIVDIKAQGIPAQNDPEAFEKIKNAVKEDTFYGTLYQKPLEWGNASDYVFLKYDITLRNDCLVPIDMIEVQVVPQTTDILQMPDLKVKSLELKSEGVVSVEVLATKDTHPVREIIVTYYLWGVSGNVKTIYGQ